MKLDIGYPSRDEEKEIVRWAGDRAGTPLDPVAGVEEVFRARERVAAVHVEEAVLDYIVELAFATREPARYGLEELESLIDFGTSPRASIFLARTARARAWLRGRSFVLPDDVKAMAPMVLPHRLRTTYEADARGIGTDEVVRRVLEAVSSP